MKSGAKQELTKIKESLLESVQYIRGVVSDSGSNVTQGKRVQR